MDRDTKFTAAFRQILADAGTEPVRLPPRSPNLNAHLERFWRSLCEECLDRMISFGESSLRKGVNSFIAHYHPGRQPSRFGQPAHRTRAGGRPTDWRRLQSRTLGRATQLLLPRSGLTSAPDSRRPSASGNSDFPVHASEELDGAVQLPSSLSHHRAKSPPGRPTIAPPPSPLAKIARFPFLPQTQTSGPFPPRPPVRLVCGTRSSFLTIRLLT
jgi:hypothetical protein